MKIKEIYPNFIPFNANPKNRKCADCVIRAISTATGLSWEAVFDELVQIARQMYREPSEKQVYEKFLAVHGFTKVSYQPKAGETRPTVHRLAFKTKGKAIFQVANHLVCAIAGSYYDIWDCGDKAVYSAWIKD